MITAILTLGGWIVLILLALLALALVTAVVFFASAVTAGIIGAIREWRRDRRRQTH